MEVYVKEDTKVKSIIDKAIFDSKYISTDIPYQEGIFFVILVWTILYGASSFLITIFDNTILKHIMLEPNNLSLLQSYYSFKRMMILFLFSLSIIGYFIALKNKDMTIKERDFMKYFSIFVVLISLSRMFFVLTFYVNTEMLLKLYDSLPLDLIVSIIAIYLLYQYTNNKLVLIILLANILLFFFNIYLSSTIMSLNDPFSPLFRFYGIFILFLRDGYSIIITFVFILIALKLKQDKKYEW